MSHRCPRPGCTAQVPTDMFACRGDWYALPETIRTAMWRAWRSGHDDDHFAARQDAAAWYRDHPLKGATT